MANLTKVSRIPNSISDGSGRNTTIAELIIKATSLKLPGMSLFPGTLRQRRHSPISLEFIEKDLIAQKIDTGEKSIFYEDPLSGLVNG